MLVSLLQSNFLFCYSSHRNSCTIDVHVFGLLLVTCWVRVSVCPFDGAGPSLPEPQAPAEEQSSVHPGHSAWCLPASAAYSGQIRGEPAADPAEWERVLQSLHRQPYEEIQTSHPTVQGGEGEDVRGAVPGQVTQLPSLSCPCCSVCSH